MVRTSQRAVIDLFAGPGGLGEGFSAYRARGAGHPFRIAMSVEMDEHAHRTLRLRSFFRQFSTRGDRVPEDYYHVLRGTLSELELSTGKWSIQWRAAEGEALCAELGTPDGDVAVDARIRMEKLDRPRDPVVLLGGPPCQAYSLVGRARNRGIVGYRPEHDGRHVLYQQYLRILNQTWPAAFVMENVKGILSSRLNGTEIFPRILEDLHDPHRSLSRTTRTSASHRYSLHTLAIPGETSLWSQQGDDLPSSFLVRAEQHGIPQRRHRVFVVGIRDDLDCPSISLLQQFAPITLGSIIADLPSVLPRVSGRLRGKTPTGLGPIAAARTVLTERVLGSIADRSGAAVADRCRTALRQRDSHDHDQQRDFIPHRSTKLMLGGPSLKRWLSDKRLDGICNHVAKSHMPSDLARYVFASSFASCHRRSPKLEDFPRELLPDHANVSKSSGRATVFADRFRVQLAGEPATTITSHLAKDGHYYIHPDPMQMRSLTVREAARAQTFPDNYFFCGPRTAQYQQVGNAVPPYLALQIAEMLHEALTDAGV